MSSMTSLLVSQPKHKYFQLFFQNISRFYFFINYYIIGSGLPSPTIISYLGYCNVLPDFILTFLKSYQQDSQDIILKNKQTKTKKNQINNNKNPPFIRPSFTESKAKIHYNSFKGPRIYQVCFCLRKFVLVVPSPRILFLQTMFLLIPTSLKSWIRSLLFKKVYPNHFI